jgi:hypothetical protein
MINTDFPQSTTLCEPCGFYFVRLAVKTNNLIGTRMTQIKQIEADLFLCCWNKHKFSSKRKALRTLRFLLCVPCG